MKRKKGDRRGTISRGKQKCRGNNREKNLEVEKSTKSETLSQGPASGPKVNKEVGKISRVSKNQQS